MPVTEAPNATVSAFRALLRREGLPAYYASLAEATLKLPEGDRRELEPDLKSALLTHLVENRPVEPRLLSAVLDTATDSTVVEIVIAYIERQVRIESDVLELEMFRRAAATAPDAVVASFFRRAQKVVSQSDLTRDPQLPRLIGNLGATGAPLEQWLCNQLPTLGSHQNWLLLSCVDALRAIGASSDHAIQSVAEVFTGWVTLRQGHPEHAIKLLEALLVITRSPEQAVPILRAVRAGLQPGVNHPHRRLRVRVSAELDALLVKNRPSCS